MASRDFSIYEFMASVGVGLIAGIMSILYTYNEFIETLYKSLAVAIGSSKAG